MLGTLFSSFNLRSSSSNKFIDKFRKQGVALIPELTLANLRLVLTRPPYEGMTLLTYFWIVADSNFLITLLNTFQSQLEPTDITYVIPTGKWQHTSILSWAVCLGGMPVSAQKGDMKPIAQGIWEQFRLKIKLHDVLQGDGNNPCALWWACANYDQDDYFLRQIWSLFSKQLNAAHMRAIARTQAISPRMPLWFISNSAARETAKKNAMEITADMTEEKLLTPTMLRSFLSQGAEFFSIEDLEHQPEGTLSIDTLLQRVLSDNEAVLISARNAFFRYMKMCENEEGGPTQSDRLTLNTLAEEALEKGYVGAYYELGLFLGKYNHTSPACDAFSRVPSDFHNFHEANRLGAMYSLCSVATLALKKIAAQPFLKKALIFAHNCEPMVREMLIIQISIAYLGVQDIKLTFSPANAFVNGAAFAEHCFTIFEQMKEQKATQYREEPLDVLRQSASYLTQFDSQPQDPFLPSAGYADDSDEENKISISP